MNRNRVIPCLLIQNGKLVKTVNFKNPRYIGDPINAVKIFNDKEVDELIVLDITASLNGYEPNIDFIRDFASEAFMPFAYGGGVNSLKIAASLFRAGVEKVVVNSAAAKSPDLIKELSNHFGSQSIVVSIDAKKNLFGNYELFSHSATVRCKKPLIDFLQEIEMAGAGEIVVGSIDRDGTMEGYDNKLIKLVSDNVKIPVIAVGGAGKIEHFNTAFKTGGASAVAAGSFFIYHGKHKAVLISYPEREIIDRINDNER